MKPITIPAELALTESMNYAFLKRKGIDSAQHFSGEIWTDYNEHDPGITILEQLCYAMTELGYKINFDIEDIFYARSKNKQLPDKDYVLLNPPDIFPCNPLTLHDYRKLLIDYVPAVKNAWFIAKNKTRNGLNVKGLYKVLIQIDPNTRRSSDEVLSDARKVLNAHRNLGEDFEEIEVLLQEKIIVAAEITLKPNAVGESVLAQIAAEISHALTPEILLRNLEELGRNLVVEEVFNGPEPKFGLITDSDLKNSELSQLNTLQKSKLIRIISQVEGVGGVAKLRLYQKRRNQQTGDLDFIELQGETLQFDENTHPVLDIEELFAPSSPNTEYCCNLMTGDVAYRINTRVVSNGYDLLLTRQQVRMHRLFEYRNYRPASDLNADEIEYFHSVQHHFPRLYGIGAEGLPPRNSLTPPKNISKAHLIRHAQAKQLKGFLLPFEQLMADCLSQLTHLRYLFSVHTDLKQTYYSQVVSNTPRLAELLFAEEPIFKKEVEALVLGFDRVTERRQRFLDHLLARFGESFLPESLQGVSRQSSLLEYETFDQQALNAKALFLNDYRNISRRRGAGMNYENPIEDISGLKKKISLLFNIKNDSNSFLTGSVTGNLAEVKTERTKPSTPKANAEKFTFSSSNAFALSEILEHGLLRENYSFKNVGKEVVISYSNPESNQNCDVYTAQDEESAEKALIKLLHRLHEINESCEGFHLIEHVLLRPLEPPQKYLLLTGGTKIILRSANAYSNLQEGISRFVVQMKTIGQQLSQYVVKEDDAGSGFAIYLNDGQKGVLAKRGGFTTKAAAEKELKVVHKTVEEWVKNNSLEAHINPQPALKTTSLTPDDPYSYIVSAVFPNWTTRFQNKNFQGLVENTLRLHAPAHLRVNCYWLDIPALSEFEKNQAEWAAEKGKEQADLSKLDKLSWKLSCLLKTYQLQAVIHKTQIEFNQKETLSNEERVRLSDILSSTKSELEEVRKEL